MLALQPISIVLSPVSERQDGMSREYSAMDEERAVRECFVISDW